MRGSTALETTFEVILGLRHLKLGRKGQAGFVAEFTKFRGKADSRIDPRQWLLQENGWNITFADPTDLDVDQVLLAVRSMKFTSQTEIAEMMGVHKSNVSRRLNMLTAQGELKAGEVQKLFSQARDLKLLGDRFDDGASHPSEKVVLELF